MPLSEHEQRMLEQMERALYAEDPKFASALRGSDLRSRYRRRAAYGVVGFAVGMGLLMTGVVVQVVPVSVVGFVLMLGAAFFAVSSWRRTPTPGELGEGAPSAPSKQPQRKQSKSRSSLMERMEERWRRRREEGGR